MSAVVYKFGGSSLADCKKLIKAANIVKQEYSKGNGVVVVVSAQGDETDHLLAAAAELLDTPSGHELDALLSTGEIKSAALFSMALESVGVPACSLTASQCKIGAKGDYQNAKIDYVSTDKLLQLINSGRVAVVTGFQGVDEQGSIKTLGRGGSDATACAIAGALGCSCVICTDVDGVFTADPRIVPQAHRLDTVDSRDMLRLASNGSGVLMDRSVQLAIDNRLPLAVRNCEQNSKGTLLVSETADLPQFSGVACEDIFLVRANICLNNLKNFTGMLERYYCRIISVLYGADEVCVRFIAPKSAAENLKAEPLCSGISAIPASKITLVGNGALSCSCQHRFISCLAEAGISLLYVWQGSCEIFAAVKPEHKHSAAAAVHGEFIK